MSNRTVTLLLVFVAAIGLLATPAVGQVLYMGQSTDGTPIPDVNKPGVTGGGGGANPLDMSCWQAAAANVLGAAGYGTGPNAQMRADSIYMTLRNDLGWTNRGSSEYAINYWLYEYGKNPNSPEYQPTNAYTDMTVVARALTSSDYTFLINELQGGQYIEVSFYEPGHAMTLVGGIPNAGQTSVWHDSDWNAIPPGDDSYANYFAAGGWDLKDQFNQTIYAQADGYVTLCPGLNKPENAMRNYDVAYFLTDNEKTPGPTPRDGYWTAEFREAGVKQPIFDDPLWLENGTVCHLDNELDMTKQKEVSLLVDFAGRDIDPSAYPIQLRYIDIDTGLIVIDNPVVSASEDGGQVLYTWKLGYQPEWEEIVFPSATDFCFLEGAVNAWDVAVICVPEPSAWAMFVAGGIASLAFFRKRRKVAA